MKEKIKTVLRDILKWGSLGCFMVAVLVICIEAAIPADISANQSNNVAGVVQDELNKNHDKETIRDLNSFDIQFDNNKKEYFVGDKLKFDVSYDPIDTSFRNLEYKVGSPELIDLNIKESTITFLKEGATYLKITSERNSELTKIFNFNINKINVESLKINNKIQTLNIGDTQRINFEIIPLNATYKEVVYKSSRKDIVSIDQNGTLKALKGGSSTITVFSKDNENIFDAFDILVYDNYHNKVDNLIIPNLEIYNNQTKELKVNYFPLDATFNMNSLIITTNDKNTKITKGKIIKASSQFTFKIKYSNSDFKVQQEILLSFKYNDIIIAKTLTVFPQVKLNNSLIDMPKLKTNYTGYILNSTYYSIPEYKQEIKITIPFINDVTKNPAKYALNDYYIDFPVNFKLLSSTYNNFTLQLLDNNLRDNTIKYFFNKNDKENFIKFTIKYELKTSDEHIVDIRLNKFYENNKPLELLSNKTYKQIFDYHILTNQDNLTKSKTSNSILKTTQISIDIENNDNKIIELKSVNNNYTIKTIKPGEVTLIVTSKFESMINSENKILKKYKVKVTDKPSNSKLTIDSKEYSNNSLTITKKDHNIIALSFFKTINYADGTSSNLEVNNINYDVQLNTKEFLNFNKETGMITPIKGGETILTFIPTNKDLEKLSKSIKIIIDHIEIDKDSFKVDFIQTSTNSFNKANKDFSIIPLGTEFTIKYSVNENATVKNIGVLSSNPSVIFVDEKNFSAKALQVGESNLVIYSKDNPDIKITKSINVINTSSPFEIDLKALNPLKYEVIKDKNDKISHYVIDLHYGKGYHLKINPLDATATSSKITYSFVDENGNESDKNIISIDSKGNISTKNIGKTWLRITYGDNKINQYKTFIYFNVYRDQKMSFKEMAYKLRKLIGHFGLYATTALSGLLFIFLEFKNKYLQVLVLIIYTMLGRLLGFGSERIQAVTPGRGCTLKDSLLNSFGFSIVSLTSLVLLIISIIVKNIIHKRNIKKTYKLMFED